MIDSRVSGDRQKPRSEPVEIPQGVKTLEGPEEDLLGHVGDALWVVDVIADGCPDRSDMATVQGGERTHVACENGLHQGSVAHGRRRLAAGLGNICLRPAAANVCDISSTHLKTT